MARILINQPVDVHSYPPDANQVDGTFTGDEHVHDFINLIPACEFALSLAKEGHLNVSLRTEGGNDLDLVQAQQIVNAWTSGKVAAEAEEIEI